MNNVLTWIEGYGFYYTNNYADDFPSWNRMMVNVLPTYGNLINAEITASGEVFAHFQEYVLKAASLGAAWEVVFDAAIEVDNPEGFPFPRGQSVMALAVDRTSSEDIFILAGLVVSIFSTFIVYGYRWNGSKFTRINSTFSISPSAGPRYGWMVKVGDAWKLSYFNGSDIASVATVNPNTFVLSDIHTVSPESGGDNVLDKSKFSPNSAVWKGAVVPRYLSDGAWIPLTGSSNVYSSYAFPHSLIDDGAGTIIYGNSIIQGYSISHDGGASFSHISAMTGTVTVVNHIGQGAYIAGTSQGKMFLVNGLDVATTGSVYDKSGNLPYLITGTFNPLLLRF